MILSTYPAALPSPSLSAVTPTERRLSSDVTGGPQQFRGLQRDYLAEQRVEWDSLSPTQATALDVWWSAAILGGGSWFACAWPAPQGWVGLTRRFLGAIQWQHIAGGFWRASARVQVRGRGLPPVIYPRLILGLHFDGNTVDEAGGPATLTSPAAIYTTTPKFGSGCLRVPFAGRLTSRLIGTFNLGSTDWQIEGWLRPTSITQARLIGLHAFVPSGDQQVFGGNGFQVAVDLDDLGSNVGRLKVVFCRTGNAVATVPMVTAINVPVGSWSHFAATQDADGMRLYLNGTLIGQELAYRLYADTPWTNQGFVIGARYAGGGWPGTYSAVLDGDLDDIAVTIGSVAYTGASFAPPTTPFVKH